MCCLGGRGGRWTRTLVGLFAMTNIINKYIINWPTIMHVNAVAGLTILSRGSSFSYTCFSVNPTMKLEVLSVKLREILSKSSGSEYRVSEVSTFS